MASLIRPRAADRGSLVVEPSSLRAALFGGHGQASGSASGSGDGKKAQSEPVVEKPWADQPWPLIETPSQTQQITHPALYIANELAHIHNAMLRGLNAIYLQVPHVEQAKDIADLSFLVQSWSTWLLDHHDLKESTMLPGFEDVLVVPAGTLTLPRSRSPSAATSRLDKNVATTMGGQNREGDEEPISYLLHRVYAYASATQNDPQAYNAATLQGLLATLADTLVPHLTGQVGLIASMREMCLRPSTVSSAPSSRRNRDILAPLPMPVAMITRTASSDVLPSPPASPSSSTFSSAAASTTSASSTSRSPPTVSLSLFPSVSTARPHHHGKNGSNGSKYKNPNETESKNMEVIDTEAKDRLARARTLLEADNRANKLTQVYLAADARASAKMDRFVVPPMIVRLRDVTAVYSAPAPALSRTTSSSSLSSMSMFGGSNAAGEWPRMSIPAVHAIADKLSPRHEGAWRFLPCDVWGRPRELPFLGLI